MYRTNSTVLYPLFSHTLFKDNSHRFQAWGLNKQRKVFSTKYNAFRGTFKNLTHNPDAVNMGTYRDNTLLTPLNFPNNFFIANSMDIFLKHLEFHLNRWPCPWLLFYNCWYQLNLCNPRAFSLSRKLLYSDKGISRIKSISMLRI